MPWTLRHQFWSSNCTGVCSVRSPRSATRTTVAFRRLADDYHTYRPSPVGGYATWMQRHPSCATSLFRLRNPSSTTSRGRQLLRRVLLSTVASPLLGTQVPLPAGALRGGLRCAALQSRATCICPLTTWYRLSTSAAPQWLRLLGLRLSVRHAGALVAPTVHAAVLRLLVLHHARLPALRSVLSQAPPEPLLPVALLRYLSDA